MSVSRRSRFGVCSTLVLCSRFCPAYFSLAFALLLALALSLPDVVIYVSRYGRMYVGMYVCISGISTLQQMLYGKGQGDPATLARI